MTDFIGIYDNVLSQDECQRLIDLFEKEDSVDTGTGGSTADKRAFSLAVRIDNSRDMKYNKFLQKALDKSLIYYKEKYSDSLVIQDYWKIDDEYNFQKYIDGQGYYTLHHEHGCHEPYRMLVWMLYLNNAQCGTEFLYQKKVLKARTGRMVLWPAAWTHLHKGVTPNRGIKYIMTGWFSYYK